MGNIAVHDVGQRVWLAVQCYVLDIDVLVAVVLCFNEKCAALHG